MRPAQPVDRPVGGHQRRRVSVTDHGVVGDRAVSVSGCMSHDGVGTQRPCHAPRADCKVNVAAAWPLGNPGRHRSLTRKRQPIRKRPCATRDALAWLGYTRRVIAHLRGWYIALALLLVLTGRAGAAISCLLPCDLPSSSADGEMPASHCGSSHASEELSGTDECRMAHVDSDPAAVRGGVRLTCDDAPAEALAPRVAVASAWRENAPPAASLWRAVHAPPGKCLPLRI